MKKVATGIVMEVDSSSAVIITNDGEFLKVKKPSPDIIPGQEITSVISIKTHTSFIKYVSVAAAIMLLFLPFIYFKEAYATVAYVNVDINPSLELGVDKYNKVREVIPLNKDGEVLIETVKLKNLVIEDALGKVITSAKDKGYIKNNETNNIEISIVSINEKKVQVSEDSLIKCAETTVSEINVDATIQVHNADKKTHDNAKKENMSTNKYLDKNGDSSAGTIKVDVRKNNYEELNGSEDKQDKDKAKDQSTDALNHGKNSQPDIKDNRNNDDAKSNQPGTKKNGSQNNANDIKKQTDSNKNNFSDDNDKGNKEKDQKQNKSEGRNNGK